jgi:CTP synthase (UTP-ammonia lyase)
MKRLIEYDPLTFTAVYHDYDADTDTTVISEVQDQEPFADSVKELRTTDNDSRIVAGSSRLNPYEREGIQKEWMHVARFTNMDLIKLHKAGIDLWKIDKCDWTKKKVYQILNHHPERMKWRTGNAHV